MWCAESGCGIVARMQHWHAIYSNFHIRHLCGGASQVRTGKQGEGAAGATRIGYANAVWHLVRGRVATAGARG